MLLLVEEATERTTRKAAVAMAAEAVEAAEAVAITEITETTVTTATIALVTNPEAANTSLEAPVETEAIEADGLKEVAEEAPALIPVRTTVSDAAEEVVEVPAEEEVAFPVVVEAEATLVLVTLEAEAEAVVETVTNAIEANNKKVEVKSRTPTTCSATRSKPRRDLAPRSPLLESAAL